MTFENETYLCVIYVLVTIQMVLDSTNNKSILINLKNF